MLLSYISIFILTMLTSLVGVFEEGESLPELNMILRLTFSPCASKHLLYYSATCNNI